MVLASVSRGFRGQVCSGRAPCAQTAGLSPTEAEQSSNLVLLKHVYLFGAELRDLKV